MGACQRHTDRSGDRLAGSTHVRALPRARAAGLGEIVTGIVEASDFRYAEESDQQYLAKHPSEHSRLGGTGFRYPA